MVFKHYIHAIYSKVKCCCRETFYSNNTNKTEMSARNFDCVECLNCLDCDNYVQCSSKNDFPLINLIFVINHTFDLLNKKCHTN